MGRFLWQPSGDYLSRSRVGRFMECHGIQSWQELIRRSTLDIDWFWDAALEHLGIEWSHKYSRLYDDSLGMPWTKWFWGENSTSFITASTATSAMVRGPKPPCFLSRTRGLHEP